MSKHLAIDIGNVICHLKLDEFLEPLTRASQDIDLEEAWEFLEMIQCSHDLGFSKFEHELMNKFYIYDIDLIQELLQHWQDVLVPNLIMIDWLHKLLDQGVKIALVSNMGIEHREKIEGKLGPKLYKSSKHFFSCDVGARKNSLLYYKTFIDLNPEFKGAIYLDDLPQNIKVGNNFCLNGIYFNLQDFQTAQQLHARLSEIEPLILGT